MAIFDIEKDELLRLTDSQLEELTARLAEAEVAAHTTVPHGLIGLVPSMHQTEELTFMFRFLSTN